MPTWRLYGLLHVNGQDLAGNMKNCQKTYLQTVPSRCGVGEINGEFEASKVIGCGSGPVNVGLLDNEFYERGKVEY